MRRLLLPLLVLAVVIAASILASSANDAADPGNPPPAEVADSLGSPLLDVRRVPEWLRQPATDNALKREVTNALDNAPEGAAACLSVHRDGTSIADVDGLAQLATGELNRLLLLAAFDEIGGPTFTTEVVRSSVDTVEEGVLNGNLWIIGGGDPGLSTGPFITRFGDERASTSIEELALLVARELTDAGITEVAGAIVGVDAKYDSTPRVFPEAEWPASATNGNDVGGVSSLLVNNGFNDFPLDRVEPEANSRAANPTAHAASVFREILTAAGVTVSGGASAGDAPAPAERSSLASIESATIADIARRAIVDGTTAEMLFREVSVRSGIPPSSYVGSLLAIYGAVQDAGYLTEDEIGFVAAFDGSGTSPKNQGVCSLFTAILDADPSSLAVGALPSIDATALAPCAPTGVEQLSVLATARADVTAMAGRYVASNGDVITFSAIANASSEDGAEPLSSDPCAGLLPSLLDAVASHPAPPTLDELEPLPAVPAE